MTFRIRAEHADGTILLEPSGDVLRALDALAMKLEAAHAAIESARSGGAEREAFLKMAQLETLQGGHIVDSIGRAIEESMRKHETRAMAVSPCTSLIVEEDGSTCIGCGWPCELHDETTREQSRADAARERDAARAALCPCGSGFAFGACCGVES